MTTEIQDLNTISSELHTKLLDALDADTRVNTAYAMLLHPSTKGNPTAATMIHRSLGYAFIMQRAARGAVIDVLTAERIIQPDADYATVDGDPDNLSIHVHYENGDTEILFWHRDN